MMPLYSGGAHRFGAGSGRGARVLDGGTVALIALLMALVGIDGAAVGGTVDAFTHSTEVWTRSGLRRSRWVWQAVGVLFAPGALVYSGLYLIRVRPRLIAAAHQLALEDQQRRQPGGPGVPLPALDAIGCARLRLPWMVSASFAFAPIAGWTLGYGLPAAFDGDADLPPASCLAVLGVLAVLTIIQSLAFGVTLTPSELVMRGLIRRRILWSDIVAVTVQPGFGSRYARVWTRNGRSRRLRAPYSQFGIGRRQFETDFAVLQQWWAQHTPGAVHPN